jgi:hypothetical protein
MVRSHGMTQRVLLAIAWLLVGGVQAQTPEQTTESFFQFTAAVSNCPVPLGPAGNSDTDVADPGIASALREALSKGQLYTHSPLVNSSLWATVQGRTVTVEGCIAGDAYTSFDASNMRTHIENIGNSIPNVRQTLVQVRTAAQAKEGLPVPYRVQP